MYIYNGDIRDTNNLKSDKYLQINSCGFSNYGKNYTVIREKGRYDFLLLYLVSGEMEVLCNGEYKNLTDGDFLIYTPDEKQYYKCVTDVKNMWLHFGGTSAEEIVHSYGIVPGVHKTEFSNKVFDIFKKLIKQFHHPSLLKYANGTLLTLLASVSDCLSGNGSDMNNSVISEIVSYINMNYDKKLTVDALAKKAGYSKSRFSHLFKQEINTSPMAYCNDVRLIHACEMLSDSTLSISEIAHSCGFNDAMYFFRIFKKKYNMTPGEYRTKK